MKKVVKKSFKLAVDRYIEQRRKVRDYYGVLRTYARYCGTNCEYLALQEATEAQALGFRDYVVREYSAATANKYVKILSCFGRVLWEGGYLNANPWAMVRVPNSKGKRVRWYRALTIEEVGKVASQIEAGEGLEDLRDGIIFNLLFVHALRISEALNARADDYTQGQITIRSPKEGADFVLTLDEDTNNKISRFLKLRGREGGFLLPSIQKGVVNVTVSVDPKTINKRLKNYAQKAEIPAFTTHSGRTTAITKLLEDGYNIDQVRTVSRHSSASMVERYDRRRHEAIVVKYEKPNVERSMYGKSKGNSKKLAGTHSRAIRARSA
jgi:integrase/recombinase XerD